MQDLEFGDNSHMPADSQAPDNGWWIIPSLKLLIEQVEFSLSLSGDCDLRRCEKVTGNSPVANDVTSRSSTLRNDALKVCDRRFRETLEFLMDIKKSTDTASA